MNTSRRPAAGLPNDPLVQEHYGIALEASGNPAEARAYYQRALALLPEAPSETRDRLERKLGELDSLEDNAGDSPEAAE